MRFMQQYAFFYNKEIPLCFSCAISTDFEKYLQICRTIHISLLKENASKMSHYSANIYSSGNNLWGRETGLSVLLCPIPHDHKILPRGSNFKHQRVSVVTTVLPVAWGCRIHRLLLCNGVRPPTSAQDITLKNMMVRF